MKLFKREMAKRDVIELAVHIALDNLEASDRFVDATEAAFQFLLQTPRAGTLREHFNPLVSGLRMWPIKGFEKHLIFYREIPGGLEIVRVLHSARDIQAVFDDSE